jgi:hypothetical protein
VAPHLPEWVEATRRPQRFTPGCYRVEPRWHQFLWIAANELPLLDELIPFLMARSGQALDDFCQWVALRRPPEWTLTMLKYLPMAMPTREELLRRFAPVDDPEIQARRQHILQVLLDQDPKMKQQLIEKDIEKSIEEGQLTEARSALRRVLARRQFTPSKDDEARIDACTDRPTLERWHDQAVTATSVSDVLE